MMEMPKMLQEFLELIDVKSIEAMTIRIVGAIAILLAAWWVSRKLRQFIDHGLTQHDHNDEATIRTYKNIASVIVIVPAILIAVHVLGINLSTMFTTGGLFAVALAFMMKEIAVNYVSSMMLRWEGIIKPGDVLKIDGTIVRVESIGLRATSARTKDELDLLIPNSELVNERIANYTYKDSLCRVETTVGVDYSADLKEVREVLESVCSQLEWASSQKKPEVLISDFGDSAVDFKVRIWIENPWEGSLRHASLNDAIWWGLKKAGIALGSRQRDARFEEAFIKAVGREQLNAEQKEE